MEGWGGSGHKSKSLVKRSGCAMKGWGGSYGGGVGHEGVGQSWSGGVG